MDGLHGRLGGERRHVRARLQEDTMASFDPATVAAAQATREIQLTTWGRSTGQPHRGALWIPSAGERLFIRSGAGVGRNWVRNVLAGGRALLHLGGRDIPVRVRHVTDPTE